MALERDESRPFNKHGVDIKPGLGSSFVSVGVANNVILLCGSIGSTMYGGHQLNLESNKGS